MKPQLVIQDFGGTHNQDMEGTSARLLKGATWKRQRLIVIIPSDEMIPAKVALSHYNCPPPDGLIKLIERMEAHPEMACIGGLYFTKGEGGCAQIWGDIKDPMPNYRPQLPDMNGGLVECYGTGMGFNLWRLKTFKDEQIKRPWFKTFNGLDGQGVGTQDLTFWSEARKYGYRCAIDCAVKVGHYDHSGAFGPPGTMW